MDGCVCCVVRVGCGGWVCAIVAGVGVGWRDGRVYFPKLSSRRQYLRILTPGNKAIYSYGTLRYKAAVRSCYLLEIMQKKMTL